MMYTAYLFCLALTLPAFGAVLWTRFLGNWRILLDFLAFIGSGIEDPLRNGWHILVVLATLGFVLGAGAIPALRILAFQALALAATISIAYCLSYVIRTEPDAIWSALIVLSPAFAGILASLWYAIKFKQ